MKNKDVLLELVALIAYFFLANWVCQLLWNAIIPSLFNGHEIGYWQVVGIWLIIRLILPGKSNTYDH